MRFLLVGHCAFSFFFFCISAKESTVMINREVNTQESGFAYLKEEKFSYLNITALVKRFADNSFSCAFSCLKNNKITKIVRSD